MFQQSDIPKRNQFVMRTGASYLLNYLIYLQNIFLNSRKKGDESPLFPYLDSSTWELVEDEEFYAVFEDAWKIANDRISTDNMYDHNGILELERELLSRFFREENGFQESVKSFKVWWDGVAGQFAVERIVEDETVRTMYDNLAEFVGDDCQRCLFISLIYDRQQLAEEQKYLWHAVIPVEDFVRGKEKVISNLRECCS